MLYRDSERDALQNLPPEEIKALRDNMRENRNLYRQSLAGLDHLSRIIISANVFDKTDPKDEAAAGARNFAIDLLDNLGIFTEESLPKILSYALNLPLPLSSEK